MPPIKLTFSAGMAKSKRNTAATIENLIQQADSRMYENKYGEYQLNLDPDLEDIIPKRCSEILLALKEKDVYTYIHSQYAAGYAASLGKALDLPAETVSDLYIAGWLHDIGKILVSVEILRKPFRLMEQEYQCVKEHVNEGLGIIDIFGVSDTVKKAVRYHHEHWDGSGYPSGSAESEIPIEGRILKVADVFSAITIKRVYRESLSLNEALAELKRCSGTHFDPELVDVFTGLFQKQDNK
jgi:HD-GYP domain-containing protein (c-di-GMP phosphodiesterase class II)